MTKSSQLIPKTTHLSFGTVLGNGCQSSIRSGPQGQVSGKTSSKGFGPCRQAISLIAILPWLLLKGWLLSAEKTGIFPLILWEVGSIYGPEQVLESVCSVEEKQEEGEHKRTEKREEWRDRGTEEQTNDGQVEGQVEGQAEATVHNKRALSHLLVIYEPTCSERKHACILQGRSVCPEDGTSRANSSLPPHQLLTLQGFE